MTHHQERHSVDQVGGGDAFAAGLIFGLQNKWGGQAVLDFATASCFKHSTVGDVNWVSADEVHQLVSTGEAGRVQR